MLHLFMRPRNGIAIKCWRAAVGHFRARCTIGGRAVFGATFVRHAGLNGFGSSSGSARAPRRCSGARDRSANGVAHTRNDLLRSKSSADGRLCRGLPPACTSISGRFSKTPICLTSPLPALGDCHANRRFMHIQSYIRDIVHAARPPCMRLCAGHPAQPST